MTEARPTTEPFSIAPFAGRDDLERPRVGVDLFTLPNKATDRYVAGFAASSRCVEAALRLRYEVFNLELDEGLADSIAEGLDRDRFDEHMTHLVLMERESQRVVGTYRMQAAGLANQKTGIYSAQEYDLAPMAGYIAAGVELGRACLAADHRTFRAMMGMWLGIGAYMNAYESPYLFGCCSLTSQDPDDGWRALRTIRRDGSLHDRLFLSPTPAYSCGDSAREADVDDGYKLPKLFRTYIRLGAKVISGPAIDREFGTVDFLVMLDGKEIALSSLDVIR